MDADSDGLVELAGECGLDPDEARAVLEDHRYVKQVWAENRPTFDSNPALTAAMKARWAELKESND